MFEFAEQVFASLISNYGLFTAIVMGIITSLTMLILSLLKKPIKLLTSKIKNERVRKLVNKQFVIYAFAISAGLWYLLSYFAKTYFAFEPVSVFVTGALSVILHQLADGVITSSTAKQLMEIVEDVKEDGAVDEKDEDAITRFYDMVK